MQVQVPEGHKLCIISPKEIKFIKIGSVIILDKDILNNGTFNELVDYLKVYDKEYLYGS